LPASCSAGTRRKRRGAGSRTMGRVIVGEMEDARRCGGAPRGCHAGSREQALDDALTRSRPKDLAERVGFEPTGPRGPAVFKTASIDRSDTSPRVNSCSKCTRGAGMACESGPGAQVYRIGPASTKSSGRPRRTWRQSPSRALVVGTSTVRSRGRLEGQVVIDRPPGVMRDASAKSSASVTSLLNARVSSTQRANCSAGSAASRCPRDDCSCWMPSPANADVLSAFCRPARRR
jgi:hypothetical protein